MLLSLPVPAFSLQVEVLLRQSVLAQASIAQAGEEPDLVRGGWIALAGLVIVFSALIFISLFIASLPKILLAVASFWPETEERSAASERNEPPEDDPAVLAAIGFVLHTEWQKHVSADSAQKPSS